MMEQIKFVLEGDNDIVAIAPADITAKAIT